MNIIDTGGLDDRGSVTIDIQRQIIHAVNTADVILFMLDAREGVNTVDSQFSNWLRTNLGKLASSQGTNRSDRMAVAEVIVLANKTEGAHLSDFLLDSLAEAYKLGKQLLKLVNVKRWMTGRLSCDPYTLGLGEPIPISASHGDGMSDLRDMLYKIAFKRGCRLEEPEGRRPRSNRPMALEDRTIQVAIMGRPNVGKVDIE